MPVVDVGSDRGQPVPGLSEHCPTRHQLGPPQGLVYIQATEVIIDGNRLWAERQDVSVNIEKTLRKMNVLRKDQKKKKRDSTKEI